MKLSTRILSALTSAAMSLTLFAGMIPAQAEENSKESPQAVKLGNMTMTADNSFGQSILAAAGEESDTEQYDGSAGVTDVVIENGKATVSYYTPVPADLVMAFYSDDEKEMYTSVSEAVSPVDETASSPNQTFAFQMPESIPRYYVVKAYLVGAAFTPLCEAYSTTFYTESITKVRNSVPSDYDPDLVVNLDENSDHSFLVLQEDTIKITSDGTHNLLDNYDEENRTYHFTNADAALMSLRAGDIVYYDCNSSDDRFLFTVTDCSIDGSSVTVMSEETALEDAFSVMNVQRIQPLTCGLEVGKTYNETLTYLGSEEVDAEGTSSPQNRLHPLASGPVKLPLIKENFTLTLSDDILEDLGVQDGKIGVFEGELTGSLQAEVSICSVLEFDMIRSKDGTRYLSTKLSNDFTFADFHAEFEAEGRYNIWEKDVTLLFVGCKAKIAVGIELSGSYKRTLASASLSQSTEVQIPLNKTDAHPRTYITPIEANWEVDKQTEELSMGGFVSADCQFSKDLKVTLKAELLRNFERVESEGLSNEILERDYDHICKNCHQWALIYEAKIGVKYKLPKIGNADPSFYKPIFNPKWTAAEWYYSYDFDELGSGECPHKAYKIQIYADNAGEMLPDLPILVERKNGENWLEVTTLSTNADGIAAIMLEKGDYRFSATYQEESQEREMNHESRMEVVELHFGATEHTPEPPTDNPEKSTVLCEGECGAEGDHITWELDDNGTLWISGAGAMADYNSTDYAPWKEKADSITHIVVGDGITEIGSLAFYNLDQVVNVKLPDSLKIIEGGAFCACCALTSIKLPDSLEKMQITSIEGCTGLTTLTIPKNLTSIGGNMGATFPPNITEILVDPENAAYSDIDGVLFNKEQTVLLSFPLARTGSYTIPDGVEKIGTSETDGLTGSDFGGFIRCNLTSVYMPDSVISIAPHVFDSSPNLEEVRLSDNLTKLSAYAFGNCPQLKEITIPYGVEEIRVGAFYKSFRSGTMTIPGNVKTVGGSVFSYSKIEKIIFEEGVESIGRSCIRDCNPREVSFPTSLKELGTGNFIRCSIRDIYYAGSEEQWNQFEFNKNATSLSHLKTTTIHYGVASPTSVRSIDLKSSDRILAGDPVVQNDSFTSLMPGAAYILYRVADKNAEQPLSAANLLYINQYTADENGCISVDFTPVREVDGAETFVMPVPVAELEPEETTLGDVNGDGTVNASDAAQILIAAAAIGAGNESGLTETQITAADVNKDSIVNASDAAVVLIYAAAIGAGQDVKLTDFVKK